MVTELAVAVSLISAAIAYGSLWEANRANRRVVEVANRAERLLFAEKRTAAILRVREAVAKIDRARMLGMEVDLMMRDVRSLGDKVFGDKLKMSASLRREFEEGSVRAAGDMEALIEEIRALDSGDSVELEAVCGRMAEQVVIADHMEQMAIRARDAATALRASYEEDVRAARGEGQEAMAEARTGEPLPLPGPGIDGRELVALMDRIADTGAFDDIEDPAAWVREQRGNE